MSSTEIRISLPAEKEEIDALKVGDIVMLSGSLYCGRDAVLPWICKAIDDDTISSMGVDLNGAAIFHTAVSVAGVGPTSSNKVEIEGSMETLSKEGVCMHIGKGSLKRETIEMLSKYGSVYAVIPPVTALLGEKTLSINTVAFPELGIEAFFELEIKDYPVIIAAAHGESIYDR